MEYIVENGLPPATLAPQLAQALLEIRPDLPLILGKFMATETHISAKTLGCTSLEAHLMGLCGWSPALSQTPGQALAAWHIGVTESKAPVWAGQMCATQIGTSAATLIPWRLLQVSDADAQALCQAALPSFGKPSDPIWVEAMSPHTWRIHAPFAQLRHTISPNALTGQSIAGWWPDDDVWLAWRRKLNEIQMVWHNHPVNEARLENGLPAVNGVWLYGGAQGWSSKSLDESTQVINSLQPHAETSDWSGWLKTWVAEVLPLFENHLSAHTNKHASQTSAYAITLTGADRLVTLKPTHFSTMHWFKRLAQPFKKNDWSLWWHNPS